MKEQKGQKRKGIKHERTERKTGYGYSLCDFKLEKCSNAMMPRT